MSRVDIFLLDDSNNSKEEINIIKPKSYKELLIQLRLKLKNIPEYFEIFIIDNNKEIKINNEDKYKIIKDILFIREIEKNILGQSVFEINYNQLSELDKEKLDEKFNCILCTVLIKNENPYLCYKCQNIFHERCLKEWDLRCRAQNKNLICPNCRNELPIERWNKKLDYEENRKVNANLINKVNELKDNEMIQTELIKKYEKYIEKTIEIFKNILNQLNSLHKLMKLPDNNKLNFLINEYPLNFQNLEINNISNVIDEELIKFTNYFKKNNKFDNINHVHNINIINDDEIKNEIIMENDENMNNKENSLENFDLINNINFNKKKEINLKYFTKSSGIYDIFGVNFVAKNKNNIELLINGKKSELSNKCELKKGKNSVTIIIKNKLTNLSNMFNNCKSLKDISELKYLYVSESKDFSYMFYKCSLLSDITALENWNVSNCNNFEYMFCECPLLSNIKPLENWNVSNSNDFGSMFYECSKLSDIKPLQYWNVLNCIYFTNMFRGCSLLSDIRPLENWKVSNCKDFTSMFSGCKLLSNIKPLQNWNMSKCNTFQSMFFGCSSLSDIRPLQNWDVSNCNYFNNMFYGCTSLSDISPLQNWNVRNGKNFTNMFFGCSSLSNTNAIQNWYQINPYIHGINLENKFDYHDKNFIIRLYQ